MFKRFAFRSGEKTHTKPGQLHRWKHHTMSTCEMGLGFFWVFFMVFFGYFLWFSGLRLQKTCKNHKDRPKLGFLWVFFMVFWASMYGTCTRRKDGP